VAATFPLFFLLSLLSVPVNGVEATAGDDLDAGVNGALGAG
jgi:hypothetical protein